MTVKHSSSQARIWPRKGSKLFLNAPGALLEKQLVMFCPNIGLLSTCVLSLIPLLRPFSWHSFLMPVLPDKLLGFLEAPVPFIIGVQVSPTCLLYYQQSLCILRASAA